MGGTLGCAECHDHKFDPFASRDFYSMKAFFADIKETGLMPDRGKDAWGSLLSLPAPEQEKQVEALRAQLAESRARLAERMKSLEARRADWEKQLLADFEGGALAWRVQHPLSASSANGAVLTIYNDKQVDYTSYDGGLSVSNGQAGDCERTNPGTDVYERNSPVAGTM